MNLPEGLLKKKRCFCILILKHVFTYFNTSSQGIENYLQYFSLDILNAIIYIKQKIGCINDIKLLTTSKLNMSSVQIKRANTLEKLLEAVEQLSLPDLDQLMFQILALKAQRKAHSFSKDETTLLLKINKGLPDKIQKRFDELVAKRQEEILTPDEHQELLKLTDQIEKSDALRVKYMAELARLRRTSLIALMQELDIRQPAHV